MALKRLLMVSSLFAFTGCGLIGNYQSIYFYPINTTNPTQSFKGTIYNLSGKLKLTSSGGEEYSGELFSINRPKDPSDSLYVNELGFPKNWNTVYGDGFFSMNVLGSKRYSRGKLVGTSGGIVYVEIIRPNPTSYERIGVAIDSNRQVYKITF
jgi:hypothetical protein